MSSITKLMITCLVLTKVIFGQHETQFIPHIVDGGAWKSTIILINKNGLNRAARVLITLYGQDGNKKTFPFVGPTGSTNLIDLSVPGNGSIYLDTEGTQPNTQIGWVQLDQLTGDFPISALLVFKETIPGKPDQEVVAPAMRLGSHTTTYSFDNTNGYVTGFAVLLNGNTSSCPIFAHAIYDDTGTLLSNDNGPLPPFMVLPPNGQGIFVSTDVIPETRNRRGILTIGGKNCSLGPYGNVLVLGLRFSPNGAITNLLPVGFIVY